MEMNLCLIVTIFQWIKTLKSPKVRTDQKLCLFFANKTDYYQCYVQVWRQNMIINKQQIIYRNSFIKIFKHRSVYD
jgi:hypothetical protein